MQAQVGKYMAFVLGLQLPKLDHRLVHFKYMNKTTKPEENLGKGISFENVMLSTGHIASIVTVYYLGSWCVVLPMLSALLVTFPRSSYW